MGGHLKDAFERMYKMSTDTHLRHRDLLSESSTQGVSPGEDDPVLHPELEEGVSHRVDLRDEVLVGHRHLAGLVATLLCIGDLVKFSVRQEKLKS